jgi:outer membrane receptor protein involved in Fe transport
MQPVWGGIINIILKKNQNLGFNGQVNVAFGTRDKYTGGLNLNYGSEKFNIYSSYNYQNRRRFRKGEANRTSSLQNASPILDQNSYSEEVDISHLLRGGIDYTISENSVLGIYSQGNFGSEDGFEILNQRSLNAQNQLDSLYVKDITEIENSDNFETGINYTFEIDTTGQRFYTSFSYARDNRKDTEEYLQRFFNRNEEIPSKGLVQVSDRSGTSTLYIFQADYEKPRENGATIETGVKGTSGQWNRGQEFFQGDESSSFEPVRNDTISDAFNYKEDVYAGYFIYKSKTGKIGYQAGIRGEYTETLSQQENRANRVVNNYFNLFPSLYVTYTLAREEELTANYSRRISRPNMWGLAPLYKVDDLLNVSIGNPYLQPEFTESYELGYMKGWNWWLLNGTVYHRYSTDVTTRITRLTEDNVAIQTRENADTRSSTGFELINQLQFTDWFDATLIGNFFYSKVVGENIEKGFSNSDFSWTISALSNMAVPNFLTFQLQGNYRGPIVLPQGELLPYWTVNVGAKKEIINNKATISLNVSDIFNTGIFRIKTEDSRFSQDRVFNRETRIGTLSFTYRFGSFQERKQNRDNNREFDEDVDF